jgi:hypothetical protein
MDQHRQPTEGEEGGERCKEEDVEQAALKEEEEALVQEGAYTQTQAERGEEQCHLCKHSANGSEAAEVETEARL